MIRKVTFAMIVCAVSLVSELATSGSLTAQARPTASGPGSFIAVGGGVSAFHSDYGQNSLAGAFAFVDLQPQWRVGFELEYRALGSHTTEQVRQSDYLVGVRATLRPTGWSPYVKVLAGDGHIDFPFGYARGDYLAIVPGAGVEYSLGNRVTLRALELEYQYWPRFSFGAMKPYGISTGLSFRLNGLSSFPNGARVRH